VDPGQVVGQPGQARVAALAMFGQIREFLGETPGQETKTDRRSSSPAAPAAG
jgi:hypothetical protein